MINKIDQIVMLASQAEDEEGTWVGKAGLFSDYMNIVAVVLIIVGLAIIYFACLLYTSPSPRDRG